MTLFFSHAVFVWSSFLIRMAVSYPVFDQGYSGKYLRARPQASCFPHFHSDGYLELIVDVTIDVQAVATLAITTMYAVRALCRFLGFVSVDSSPFFSISFSVSLCLSPSHCSVRVIARSHLFFVSPFFPLQCAALRHSARAPVRNRNAPATSHRHSSDRFKFKLRRLQYPCQVKINLFNQTR